LRIKGQLANQGWPVTVVYMCICL